MGFLAGLIHNDEEENNKHNNEERYHEQIESSQRGWEEQDEYGNWISSYEAEKRREEADLREKEYSEKLKTSEENYKKLKGQFALIDFPDNEIEQKVQVGELTLTVIDKMKFYLSKIDRTVLRQCYEGTNWDVIRGNIDGYEEYAYVKGNLISRCMRK